MQDQIPPPGVLWARIALYRAFLLAAGVEQSESATGGRIEYDDGGGNWATLVRYPDDHAVLFGWDRNGDSEYDGEPYDPLAEAPRWVPITELNPQVLTGDVGFVRWWDEGEWHRAPPELDDGLEACLGDLCNADTFALACIDLEVFDEDSDTAPEKTVHTLHAAAEQNTLDRPALDVLSSVEPAARDEAFAFLQATSVTRGCHIPTEPYPVPASAPRQRRRITEFVHANALAVAMRAATELPREPPPPTAELARVLNEITAQTTGPIDKAYRVTDNAVASVADPRNRLEVRDLWQLRAAEAAEHGRWLFIRFHTEDGQLVVDRAYDHWPTWYLVSPCSPDLFRSDIVTELAARPPRWRPGWAPIAADGWAYTPAYEPPAPHFADTA